MLKSLKISGEWASRVGAKDERIFTFEAGINLLVGPNGSGKSSILQLLMKHGRDCFDREEVEKCSELVCEGSRAMRYFDFEKNNPRTLSMVGAMAGFQLSTHWWSHGETNQRLGEGLLLTDDVKDAVVLMDEPDQALDFDGCVKLLEHIESCPAAQILVCVHHPVLVLSNHRAIELVSGYRDRMREALKGLV
jgi:predicted ATPase